MSDYICLYAYCETAKRIVFPKRIYKSKNQNFKLFLYGTGLMLIILNQVIKNIF